MNKKLIFILLGVIAFSCKKELQIESKNQFRGIGELLIGAKFDSIPSYKLFEKDSDEIYRLEKYELTKKIGIVENVTVKTQKGRISEVTFELGKYSSEFDVDDYLKNTKEESFSKDGHLSDETQEMLFYSSFDEKISISKVTMKDKELAVMKGYYLVNYSYYDTKLAEDFLREKDSLEKAEYLKDVKK